MRKSHVALIALFALYSFSVAAQDFSNKGKEFWLAYCFHVGMVNGGGSPTMTLYITSDVSTSYTVEVYNTTVLQTGTITAGQVVLVTVPNSYFVDNEGSFNNKAIRVTADKPVVVYSFITRSAASAATLCLPTNVLGKEYYSSNFTQTSNEANSHSYITIIGVEDNTSVEITPSANTKNGWIAGTTQTINLNKGTVYQVLGALNTGTTGVDLTGTKIKSVATATSGCKRIAVFSGSGKINIGCSNGSADNLYQQLYPVGTWGKKYLTVPSYQRPNNYYRIIKSSPFAKVYLNRTLIPSASFVNGLYYEFQGNIPNQIESDEPISVAQYFTSQGCSGNSGNYDPDMIVLNPVEQNINKVTLVTTNLVNAPAQHNIHVIMRNTGTGLSSFKLDGANYPVSSWTTHPVDATYSYTYLSNVTQGFHRLESDSGFNALVYGYASAESYGYSAGANVKDLYQFVSIQNQQATVNFPSTCRNTPFYFSMTFPYEPTEIKWVFGSALNNLGITDVTINSPVFDSTFQVNGKWLYRYKLSSPYSINTPGTYPIKVIAQNPTPDGCSGEQEINYDVQVFDRPSAGFAFTSTGCLSDSVRFQDVSGLSGQTAAKWFWNFDDGQFSALRNPAHLYGTGKTYNVQFAFITDIGCLSDTITKPVVISAPPDAKFGITGPTCIGKTIVFSDSSTSATAAIVKWTWDFGDNSAPVVATTNAPQSHTYATAGIYKVTLQVENASGCKSSVTSVNVTVSPNPAVNFNFGRACLPNGAIQFTDVSTISDGTQNSFVYAWNFGDGGTSAAKSPSHIYPAIGPYPAKLVVTSVAGCKDSVTRNVDSIFAQPQAKFSAPAEVCFGAAVNFTDQSTTANSTVTGWTWDFGDNTSSTQQNPTHTYTAPGKYTVKLLITTALGCQSAVVTNDVTVNALPVADFTPSAPVCVSRTITFTDKSIANAGAISKWTWNFGDNSPVVVVANGNPQAHVYNSTSTYPVTLQVETNKGCISTVTTKPIVINPLPVPGFAMPGNCVNDPVSQFFDTSSIADGSQNSFTYTWNFGDANASAGNPNTSVMKDPLHKFSATGNYNVQLKVTSNKGCTDSITQVFTINGAVPASTFTVTGGLQHCSNDSIRITDNSSVFPGKLVKLEIFWDYANDPTNVRTISNPVSGATYAFKYPEFFTPTAKPYVIRVVAYSGINCLSSSQQTITMLATPEIDFPAIPPVCADAPSFQVSASVTNMAAGNGVFTGGGVLGAGLFNPTTAGAGTYVIRYTYTGANGCVSFKEQNAVVYPVPVVNAGPDRFVLEGGTAALVATASGTGLKYLWTPATYLNNPTTLKPVTKPADDINYTLTVTSADGCTASDQVFVKVLKAPVIPNVFSPNGDGINDKWEIKYLESYPGATVEIFNRYGQKIFESRGYGTPWDGNYKGSQAPAGTYYYIINPKNGRQQIAGYVDIIR